MKGCIAVVVAVLVGIATFIYPGVATASSVTVRPPTATDNDAAGKASTRPVQIKPRSQHNDCAQVRKKLTRLAAQGQKYATCTKPGKRPKESVRRATSVRDGVFPVPEWCYLNWGNGFWGTRTEQCEADSSEVTVFDVKTGQIVGGLIYQYFVYSFTATNATAWQTQLPITEQTAWGLAVGDTKVQATAYCDGFCTSLFGDFPAQPVQPDSVTTASGAFVATNEVTPGDFSSSTITVDWWFSNPAWVAATNRAQRTVPGVRCDNALPGFQTAGCVFGDVRPTIEYSQAALPELADHIRDAQALGLPGTIGNGPLTRLTDPDLRRKNGDTACRVPVQVDLGRRLHR